MTASIDFEYILELCEQYASTGYYVEGLIPDYILSNARKSFPIPESVRVIALMDATFFGSCKTGLAITAVGIIWRNNWLTSSDRTFLDWEMFCEIDIQKDKHLLGLGEGNFFSTYSDMIDLQVELLQEIQDYVDGELYEYDDEEMYEDSEDDYDEAVYDDGQDVDVEDSVDEATENEHSDYEALEPPPLPKAEWLIAVSGKQYGPYDLESLQSMVQSNQINPELTYVWRRGMSEWVLFMMQPDTAALAHSTVPSIPTAPLVPDTAASIPDSIERALSVSAVGDEIERVDVNRATFDQLIVLPGIGAAQANLIIQHREVNGGYHSPEQIGQLLGLKPHMVERLRKHIVFHTSSTERRPGRMIDF